MDILIQGGTVASDGIEMAADVGITAGVISHIGRLTGTPARQVIDATGRLVLPGFVDLGICLPRDGFCLPSPQNLLHLTRQAAMGGVTTVIVAADLDPDRPLPEALGARVQEDLGLAHVDFGYHLYIPGWNDERRRQILQASGAGIPSVWIPRLGLEGHPPQTALAHAVMRELPEDFLLLLTPFDPVYDRFIRADLHQRRTVAPQHAPLLLPEWLEASAVASFGAMLRQARCRALVVGLTCSESLRELARLREEGLRLAGGVSLAHLALAAELLEEQTAPVLPPSWPPLRSRAEVQALWSGLEDGLISIVSSMHSPRTMHETAEAQKDVASAPAGVAGLEHFGAVLHSEGLAKWRLSPGGLSQCAAADPAKLAGLYPRKGSLQIGSDADVVIINPGLSSFGANRVAPEDAYSPYANLQIAGIVETVLLRGEPIVAAQELRGDRHGAWLERRLALK